MSIEAAVLSDFRQSLDALADKAPHTERSDEDRMARARSTFMARVGQRTAVDLETCIHCGMCAEACHFYMATENERYTPAYKVEPLRRFYRREISPLRLLNRVFVRKVDLEELAQWSELVFDACTGCGRCDMMCPMGINISESIGIMREGLAAAGLVPDELAALQAEQRERNSVFGVGADQLRAAVADLANGKEVPLDKPQADVLLLSTAVEVRLFRGAIAAAAKILNKAGVNWTMSTDAFEAANLGLISGDRATRKAAVSRIVDKAKEIGAKTVVVPESGHAYQSLRWESANDIGEALPFEVVAISEFVTRAIDEGKLSIKKPGNLSSVTYHDPCRLARQGGVFEEPRAVLKAMGLDVRETESNGRENLCCGGGCGEYAIGRGAALRQRAFNLKRHELDHTGADAVVTGCNNCRINLAIGAEQSGWEMPVVSLAETVADNLAE